MTSQTLQKHTAQVKVSRVETSMSLNLLMEPEPKRRSLKKARHHLSSFKTMRLMMPVILVQEVVRRKRKKKFFQLVVRRLETVSQPF
jgi:hypothetical protein